MTQSGYTSAIVDTMLSWLKGLASWVLKLFNLSGGASPLKFLANNWLKLLILFLLIGVAVDLLVWLVRWRPHWVWFHKKRVIINDKNFFSSEKGSGAHGAEPVEVHAQRRMTRPRRDWVDSEFVVPGAERRRREEQAQQQARIRKAREERLKSLQAGEPTDVFQDALFDVNAEQKSSDTYEDAVFSVSNLPKAEAGNQPGRKVRVQPVRRKNVQRPAERSKPRVRSARPEKLRAHSAKPEKARSEHRQAKMRPGMVRGQKRPASGARVKREP